jgi:L-asparaginase II/GNAT superfamily N-acetyltransferase
MTFLGREDQPPAMPDRGDRPAAAWCAEDPCSIAALTWEVLLEPVAAVLRGPAVESVHRGAIAVCDPAGRLLGGAGDPRVPVVLRSAAKPFQALALVASGAADEFGVTDEELAVICASHGGEPHQVKLVAGLLERAGADPADLVCGIQEPVSRSAREALTDPPSTLHNMCSGKHAAMLLLARHLGAPLQGYHLAEHPVQQSIGHVIAGLVDVPPDGVFVGTDGCGIPVVRIPLLLGARLYALLAEAASPGLRRVRDAMLGYADCVAPEGRFDRQAMNLSAGTLLTKSGADGVQGLALVSEGLGAMIKVADGASRPVPVLVADLLLAWERPEGRRLWDSYSVLTSRAGEPVGRIIGLIEQTRLRRALPLRTPTKPPDDGGKEPRIVLLEGREREVNRFRREQWPRADEEILGRTYDWTVDRLILGAREGRALVGLLGASVIGGVATVEELIVHEDHRGGGLGTLLLSAFESEARALGVHKVVLRTPLGARAEAFYLGRGYRRESLFARHHFGHHYLSLRKDLT